MLRRTFSQPVGLDRLRFSEYLTSDGGKLMSENVLEQGVGWKTAVPKRSLEYEGVYDDKKSSEKKEALYDEEEEIWDSLDFNLQAKAYIVNLLHSRKRLMKMNANLQQALNTSEDSKAAVDIENTSLRRQLKSINKLAESNARMLVEMNEMQGTLDDSKTANSHLKSQNYQLQKEMKALKNQTETMANEICDFSHKMEVDNKNLLNQNQLIKAQQQQVALLTTQLDDQDETIYKKDLLIQQQNTSLEELTTILQELRERTKNLESQLQLASVIRKGSVLNPDGTFILAVESSNSLAEELGVKAGLLQRVNDDIEVDGHVDLEVKVMEKSLTITSDLHQTVDRAVSSEIDKVEVSFERMEIGAVHEEVITLDHVEVDLSLQESKKNIKLEVVEKVIIYDDTEEVRLSEAGQESFKAGEMVEAVRFLNAQEITQLDSVAEVVRLENAQEITQIKDVAGVIRPDKVKETTQLKDVMEIETVVRPDSPHTEVEAQVVEQAGVSRPEEELALDQNSNHWQDDSFKSLKRGALFAAIGLGALILWKMKK